MQNIPNENFHSVKSLAQYFGVSTKTIYRKLWDKTIPAYRVAGAWKIAKKDLLWLKR
jgi:excisionase family DNA binding protein